MKPLIRPSDRRARSGLTLLEVIVSTAIFLASFTAIVQIMSIGHDSRLSARLNAEAALRSEALMGELVSGIRPLIAESAQQFEGEENWIYDIEIGDGGGESLLQVVVRVRHMVGEQNPNGQFQLVRLMRDPQLFLDAALEAEASE